MTAFGARGSVKLHRTVLVEVLGWPQAEAEAAIFNLVVEQEGHDPADPPDVVEFCYRLCPACAEKVGCAIGEFNPSDNFHSLPGIATVSA